jgi:hypothetical protein
MKRTKAIRLVLLGGGVAAMLAACGDREDRRLACEKARAEMRPDAEEICRRSTTSSRGGYFSSWGSGRTTTDTGSSTVSGKSAAPSTSSRGGFGSTASSVGS